MWSTVQPYVDQRRCTCFAWASWLVFTLYSSFESDGPVCSLIRSVPLFTLDIQYTRVDCATPGTYGLVRPRTAYVISMPYTLRKRLLGRRRRHRRPSNHNNIETTCVCSLPHGRPVQSSDRLQNATTQRSHRQRNKHHQRLQLRRIEWDTRIHCSCCTINNPIRSLLVAHVSLDLHGPIALASRWCKLCHGAIQTWLEFVYYCIMYLLDCWLTWMLDSDAHSSQCLAVSTYQLKLQLKLRVWVRVDHSKFWWVWVEFEFQFL